MRPHLPAGKSLLPPFPRFSRSEAVLGLDFSGARDAGRKIWIAEGTGLAEGVRILRCFPAAALPGATEALEPALTALSAWLAQQPHRAVGCDFPFSLPPAFMAPGDWLAFVTDFSRRFPSPEAFRQHCHAIGPERDERRRTDQEAKTPFAASNIRLYRQTYNGIRGILQPLVTRKKVRVPPFQALEPSRMWLLETCPASALKRMGLYRRFSPYKGAGLPARQNRAALLRHLRETGALETASASLADLLVDQAGGDALDAVLAAMITARVLSQGKIGLAHQDSQYRREGFVFC